MGRYPADPPLDCDVIMKGGITSGVIYPLAVCELAKVYRLRSVGGASAGAIAAAAAAAAEYGRAAGGFEALEQVPTGLTARSAAVGLHAVDYSVESNQLASKAADRWRVAHDKGSPEAGAAAVPRRRFAVNWFSDGGICSNLPVHFFDRPLPVRPTFAIDLAPFPAGQAKSECEADNTSLPMVNQAGLLRRWSNWPTTGLGGLAAFGGAILDSARSWVDESLLGMPGYRDRVVTIYHDEAEGGLNLDMEPPVVASLSARGQAGAAKLVTRFAGPAPGVEPAPGWENQRWVRFRTATAGLSHWVGSFRGGYSADPPGATPYRDLAGPGAAAPLPSYGLTKGRRNAVNDRTGDLLGTAERWAGAHADAFTADAPAPTPVLRLVPSEKPEELTPPPTDA